MNHLSLADTLTMRDYARVVFKRGSMIALTVAITVGTVYLGLQMKTPTYEAKTKMLISAEKLVASPFSRELSGATNNQITLTQTEVVKSNPVLERAVRSLNLADRPWDYEANFSSSLKSFLLKQQAQQQMARIKQLPPDSVQAVRFRKAVEDLKRNVSVEPIRDTNLFTINVRDFDPIAAAKSANVISRSYVIFDLEQQLAEVQTRYGDKHPAVVQLMDSIQMVSGKLDGTPMSNAEAIGTASVKIIEQAALPLEPARPNKLMMLTLAFFLSATLGVTLAFIFEYLDQTLKNPQSLARVLNAPLLGSIPTARFWERRVIRDPQKTFLKSRYTESFKHLSDQLRILINNRRVKTVLLVGAQAADGATTTLVNMAAHIAAQSMKKVLLIDANLSNGRLAKMFKVDNTLGVVEVVSGKCALDAAVKEVTPNLWILTSGTLSGPSVSVLDSTRMKLLLKEVKEYFDVVLIDCADLKSSRDALAISSGVDGIIFLVAEGRTRIQVADHAFAPLKDMQENVLGAVMTKRRFVIPKFIYERI